MNDPHKKTRVIYFTGLCIGMYIAAFCTNVQGVMLNNLIDFYRLESYRQGMMSSFQGAGSFVAVILVTLASQKLSKRAILLCAIASLALSVFIMSFSPPFALTLVAYLLMGIGTAANTVAGSALAADIFIGSGAHMSIAHAAYGLGGLTGPFIMNGMLSAGIPWQRVILISSIVAFIAFGGIIAITGYGAKRLPSVMSKANPITPSAIWGFIKEKKNVLLFLAVFVYTGAQLNTSNWIKRYMTIVMDAENIGGITLSMFWFGSMLARVIVPRLKSQRQDLLIFGCLGMAVFTAAVTFTDIPIVGMVCVFLCTLISGACIPLFLSEGCSRYEENTLVATSIISLFIYGGNMAMSPVTAAIMDRNMHGGMLFLALLALLACISAAVYKALTKKDKQG